MGQHIQSRRIIHFACRNFFFGMSANSTTLLPSSTIDPTTDPCITAGGVSQENGTCTCPEGWTSAYDAFVTNVFCNVQTEYSTTLVPGGNGTSPIDTELPVSQTVSFLGVVQLIVLFLVSMVLVCVCRGVLRCCRRKPEFDFPTLHSHQRFYTPH